MYNSFCDCCSNNIKNVIICDNCDNNVCRECNQIDNLCCECVPNIYIYNISKNFGFTSIFNSDNYYKIQNTPYIFIFNKHRWSVLDLDYRIIYMSVLSYNASLYGLVEMFTKIQPRFCIKIQTFIRKIRAIREVAYKRKCKFVVKYYKDICNEIKYMPDFGIKYYELLENNEKFYSKKRKYSDL